ncbi:MAG: aminoglycoside phosphotransferase family protein [Candidatus Thorarchaeota archaeon]|nr:aminoglycoside phosphotransferase family protein [Candidatus Thorarchaeota archaeon]
MKTRAVQSVYNLPFSEFQAAIASEVPYEGQITLSQYPLGGWSSLNFLGFEDGIPKFIAKIPPRLDGTDFQKLYSIHDLLSQQDICSQPLGIGEIGDDQKIPYFLLEYAEGKIYSDPNDIRGEHFNQLKHTLWKLNQLEIPNARKYNEGSEYVNWIMSSLKLKHAKWKKRFDNDMIDLLNQFWSNVEGVHQKISEMDWNPVTIHGDLYERNIVFQDNGVSLLDLEECCVADMFYDLAYLFTQSYTTSSIEENHFVKKGIPKDHWQNLELIALVSVISWSFNWLIDSAFENVEPNLVASVGRTTVVDYLETKMKLLSSLLI